MRNMRKALPPENQWLSIDKQFLLSRMLQKIKARPVFRIGQINYIEQKNVNSVFENLSYYRWYVAFIVEIFWSNATISLELLTAIGVIMAFPEDVVVQAWKRSGGKCECKGWKHNHKFSRCNAQLIPAMRRQEGQGRWEAHRINRRGDDTLSNCEILCWDCYKRSLYD